MEKAFEEGFELDGMEILSVWTQISMKAPVCDGENPAYCELDPPQAEFGRSPGCHLSEHTWKTPFRL